MAHPAKRDWVPEEQEAYVRDLATRTRAQPSAEVARWIEDLTDRNKTIHEIDCINLNPATNIMNPAAEGLLARGLGSRPSLGYPGDKYEMGLEAIEQIEVVAADLACEIFQSDFAEVRVASGALANLYAFMATCKPGDAIIVPPGDIGGHVTHHDAGAAGLYGLDIHTAPISKQSYTVDVEALAEMAQRVKPRLITIGGSLNLTAHPVAKVVEIARDVGAKVLFDAAHLCGMIAGGAWDNPLTQGADLMTMSTYKSLGGPAGGLIVTNDASLAEKLDAIAFPGLTANFDAGRVAALARSLLDWRDHGADYAQAMITCSRALAAHLALERIRPFVPFGIATRSHQFAIPAHKWGGGQAMAKRLRRANILTCGIGLPMEPVEGDMNGLRIGTPEVVRIGMTSDHMPELAKLIARAMTEEPEDVAPDVSAFRARFQGLQFITQ